MVEEITLTEYRIDLGYSVEELAKLLDVTVQELTAWERDQASCPFQRMLELAMDALAMEQVSAAEAEDTEKLIALADEQSEKFKEWEAEYEENRKRQEAFFIEHEQWCKENGLPVREWRYPGDRELSEP